MILALIFALILAAAATTWWYISQTRVISIPIAARIKVDKTPLGEIAFNADRFKVENISILLAPGNYGMDTASGRWTMSVSVDTAVQGGMGIRVTDRGEESGRRWVKLEAEESRLTFDPAIQVADPRGIAVRVHELSAGGTAAAVKMDPLVAQSIATLAMGRIWSVPQDDADGRPANPVREVMVGAGLITLRDSAKIAWGGEKANDDSWLVVKPGSEVRVQDLKFTGRGQNVTGKMSLALALGSDSQFRAGNNTIRLGSSEMRGTLDIHRTAEGDDRGTIIELDGVHIRVPKQDFVVALASAVPKSVALKDQPIADKALFAFKEVHLAELLVEPGEPAFDFAGGQITFSGQPVVRGTLKALRPQIVMRTRDGPAGIKITLPDTDWVPVKLPLAVPVALTGKATVELVAGRTLADSSVQLNTVCDSVVIGEPIIEGLPDALKPITQLVGVLLNKVPVKDQTLPEYLKRMASREDRLPLMGSNTPPKTAAFLERTTLRSFSLALVGDEVVVNCQVTLRIP
jgi:hypothetical protein